MVWITITRWVPQHGGDSVQPLAVLTFGQIYRDVDPHKLPHTDSCTHRRFSLGLSPEGETLLWRMIHHILLCEPAENQHVSSPPYALTWTLRECSPQRLDVGSPRWNYEASVMQEGQPGDFNGLKIYESMSPWTTVAVLSIATHTTFMYIADHGKEFRLGN